MAITSYELAEVVQDGVTADLIVWWRYKTIATGIVEAMLDYNPQLAVIHRNGPQLPVGTLVMIPIDQTILSGKASSSNQSNFWLNPAS